jgi:hypothetical protein
LEQQYLYNSFFEVSKAGLGFFTVKLKASENDYATLFLWQAPEPSHANRCLRYIIERRSNFSQCARLCK